MLNIITLSYRFENLAMIYNSIPKESDIQWILIKSTKREPILGSFLIDDRIKIVEVDCEDNNALRKMQVGIESVGSGYFHILDDDCWFSEPCYEVYKKYKNEKKMIIGKQSYFNGKVRLKPDYPKSSYIDTGNVICHSSVTEYVKWGNEPVCSDFVFWDKCFNHFGKENTILIEEVLSIYNGFKWQLHG